MTWIKICGTTNLDDAKLAADAGADAVGFVFYEESPRNVHPHVVAQIVAEVPQNVEKVGVFVDRPASEIQKVVEQTGLSAVQLYPGANSDRVADFITLKKTCANLKLILVCPAEKLSRRGVFISEATRQALYAMLFDSTSQARPGGTGRVFDWAEARGVIQNMSMIVPVIVAGGLNTNNVAEAVNTFRPHGVDVVSGVEREPGKKDPEKVRAFIKAVREAERAS